MTSLGIDIGSSSVKVSLLNIQSGKCLAAVTLPSSEMPIEAPHPGWAEQDPDMWWTYVCDAIARIAATNPLKEIKSIGITYQMHGLVCIDKNGNPLRKSIIWCDSRAVETGERAFREIGPEKCLAHLLNSPGNFTASKMAWVKQNEPEIFARTYKFFLPGDYIAYKLSGEICTTGSGLSEQILWDFTTDTPAEFVSDYYGIPSSYLPVHKPSLGIQSYTSRETEIRLGIPQGTPISYRAGDQPNNA
ncbi:MAG: FGGY family carbohydrate kinase, partial [Bacteroidales bacterium]|nr:FGGY family carbohydrate kinase [Bacteroidales bacterium]